MTLEVWQCRARYYCQQARIQHPGLAAPNCPGNSHDHGPMQKVGLLASFNEAVKEGT